MIRISGHRYNCGALAILALKAGVIGLTKQVLRH